MSAPAQPQRRIIDAHLEVYPRAAGDFGFAVVGGIQRRQDEWRPFMEAMARDIKRHIDDVSHVHICYEYEEAEG